MSSLAEYTDAGFIKRIKSKNKYKAIEELATVFQDSRICDDIEALIKALKEREQIMSTGIGFGIAIPHAKIKSVQEIGFAIGISRNGIEFDSIDSKPVNLIILVAAGERQHKEYLKILSSIMTLLKVNNIKEEIIRTEAPEKIMDILRKQNIA